MHPGSPGDGGGPGSEGWMMEGEGSGEAAETAGGAAGGEAAKENTFKKLEEPNVPLKRSL